jgi:TrmH family RNA methyltransferase
MLSKNTIKYINSLKYNKFRKKNKMFIAEGPKITGELLNSGFVIDSVFALSEWVEKNKNISTTSGLYEISDNDLKKISSLKTPNQVLAVVNIPDEKPDYGTLKNELFLVLDDISDPGNLGTIIRTADWFGVRNIICSNNTVDVYNPKVIQATMGSFIRVKIIYERLNEFFTKLPFDTSVFGALLNGENIYGMRLPSKGCIIIGNESKGISPDMKRFITHPVTIPAFGGDTSAESLNASVATAVILSEFKRGLI